MITYAIYGDNVREYPSDSTVSARDHAFRLACMRCVDNAGHGLVVNGAGEVFSVSHDHRRARVATPLQAEEARRIVREHLVANPPKLEPEAPEAKRPRRIPRRAPSECPPPLRRRARAVEAVPVAVEPEEDLEVPDVDPEPPEPSDVVAAGLFTSTPAGGLQGGLFGRYEP